MKRAASQPVRISLLSSDEDDDDDDIVNDEEDSNRKPDMMHSRFLNALYASPSPSSSSESEFDEGDNDMQSLSAGPIEKGVDDNDDDDDDDDDDDGDGDGDGDIDDAATRAAAAEIERRFVQIKKDVDTWMGGTALRPVTNIKELPPLSLTRKQFNSVARMLRETHLFDETPIIVPSRFADILMAAARTAHVFFAPLYTRLYRISPQFKLRQEADAFLCFGPFLYAYVKAMENSANKEKEEKNFANVMQRTYRVPRWQVIPQLLCPRDCRAVGRQGTKLMGKTPAARATRRVVPVLKKSLSGVPFDLAVALLATNWPHDYGHVLSQLMAVLLSDMKQARVRDLTPLLSWLLVWKSVGVPISPAFFYAVFQSLRGRFAADYDLPAPGSRAFSDWLTYYAMWFEGGRFTVEMTQHAELDRLAAEEQRRS